MEHSEIVDLVNTDPVAQALLAAPVPMRLGYLGLDGHPRTVPLAYVWNGTDFVFATPPMAYKVRAIAAHPKVSFTVDTAADDVRDRVSARLGPTVASFTPMIMMIRGTASIETRPGVPQEHIDASGRLIGDEEKLREWERIKRNATSEMAVISITPEHLTICDFITRFPPPAEHERAAHSPEEKRVGSNLY